MKRRIYIRFYDQENKLVLEVYFLFNEHTQYVNSPFTVKLPSGAVWFDIMEEYIV